VLVLYATLLAPLIPDSAAHFVIASVLGAPAAILISLIMVPETSDRRTGGSLADPDMQTSSTMDAIVKGTTSGLELLLNIIAMLLVLVALVYLANAVLGLLPEIGGAKISLQRLLGYLMAPVCWLMGLPWSQAITAGSLMGTKTVLNELIAYVDLSKLGPDALDPRSRLIMLYAMCGFAHFASLGIIVGIIHDQMLDARRLGPGAALFHQGLALTFHVGLHPALEHIDHLKFEVVIVQL
jgi:CNT family concentrative nucleoside transporter